MVGGIHTEKNPMERLYSKGKMEKKTAPFSFDRNGYYLHWNELPAWVCTQCGGACFEKEEVDKFQKVLRAIDAETRPPRKSPGLLAGITYLLEGSIP